MSFITENSQLKEKLQSFAKELNNTSIIAEMHQKMDDFLADKKNNELYERMKNCEENIVLKQNNGIELTQEDLDEYKEIHTWLNSSPQAEDFFSAQEALLNIQDEINAYVSLAIQMGEAPTDDELA
ncbi:YlbF family regulator [Lentisphaerota bacterium WC36G]